MKVKITNKKDKTDYYSLNLSKAFGVRSMGHRLVVYYFGVQPFEFSEKEYKFEKVELNGDMTKTYIDEVSIDYIVDNYLLT